MPRGWPLVIVIVLALLLFAAPKLPAMARSLGQSMRIFKSEVKQMRTDSNGSKKKDNADDADDTEAVEGTVVGDTDAASQQHATGQPENDTNRGNN